MTSRCQAVCVTLLSVAKSHQKKYCFVSQDRIQHLLYKYHKLGISNRTLNRDLGWLEANGYITRLRRIRLDSQGRLVFCSTLYKFTGKLFNWLYELGNKVKNLFSFFRLPKWADHKLFEQQASLQTALAAPGTLLLKARDGTIEQYDPRTGAIQKATI